MKFLLFFLAAPALLLFSKTGDEETPGKNCRKKDSIATIDKQTVYKLDTLDVIFFQADFDIDADGSPRAYHPQDSGIDHLAYAKSNGKLSTSIIVHKNGKPVIQGKDDPAPGHYVCMTTLSDKSIGDEGNPKKYVNSETIPFFVLPGKWAKEKNVRLGDVGLVYNTGTHQFAYAVYADAGPASKLGEGSIFLAGKLGVPNASRKDWGSKKNDFLYLVFPNSGKGQGCIPSIAEIDSLGKTYVEKIGGIEAVKTCLLK